tara:strand:+ start:1791 stop:2879 length:1089 start_codon:yes stop_codon:yes gene_type:complete
MKKVFLNIFACVFLISIYSQNADLRDYKYQGAPYYPEQKLNESDSLVWPIDFFLSIDVKDIKDLDYNSSSFKMFFLRDSYSKYDFEYITALKDTISLDHGGFVQLYTSENNPNNLYLSSEKYFRYSEYPYLFEEDLKTKQNRLIEAPFDVNWDLGKYPFDEQKLQVLFTSTVDTSIIRLNEHPKLKSSFSKLLPNIKDGFRVESITTSKRYNVDESDIIQTSPTAFRPMVTETLVFNVNLDRKGSWLFFKLFIGGVLSYFISCLVFLIPDKEFQSKTTIAIGAVFGAIGNRYFVDSVLPGVQVLTKADAISNLIILTVVLNILIMILQESDKTFFKFFQSKENSFIYSIFSFIIFLLVIILW